MHHRARLLGLLACTLGLLTPPTVQAADAELRPDTVAGLQEAWVWHSGLPGSFQATPVVVGDRMYVGLPGSHVAALDARTGREIWRYRHTPRTGARPCCGTAHRGVAVAEGKVFLGTLDARLIALDAATGEIRWDTDVVPLVQAPRGPGSSAESGAAPNVDTPTATERAALEAAQAEGRSTQTVGRQGTGIGMAPLVAGRRIIIGTHGAGYGLHTEGSVIGAGDQRVPSAILAAFDIDSGRPLWTWHVTGPGWAGPMRSSTPDHLPRYRDLPAERAALARGEPGWPQGGGSMYATPVWDAQRDLIFAGTGNPAPNMVGEVRPGDNRHTSSLVALDARSGRLVWAYQQVPHDLWGYDVASPPVLFEARWGRQRIPAVAQPSKLGWVYVHDRRNGRLLYRSEAFVPQHNLLHPPTTEGIEVAPGIAGGANWSPSALLPDRGWLVVPAIDMPTLYRRGRSASGQPFVSTSMPGRRLGTLTALDLQQSGRRLWQLRLNEPAIGGVLALGDLLFTGLGDRWLAALDARSGEVLWRSRRSAGVNAPPIAYTLDGQTHVAVAVGGNTLFGLPTGDELAVLRLPSRSPPE